MWIERKEQERERDSDSAKKGIIERLDLSDERLGDQMAEGKFGVERKGTGGYHFSPKKDAWWFAEEKSHRKET